MKTYLITITAYAPAPRQFDFREVGSDVSAATSRALKAIRKDLPRKQIKRWSVSITQL